MGTEKFCGGMYFCVGHGTLVMENFCWAWNFWSWENIFVVVGHVICGHGKIFVVGHVICGHGKFFWTCNIWSNFVCRTSRAKGAFKCWKAYGKYCLWILNIINEAGFQLFSKLYWTRNVMSTRISSYSMLCQNGVGIPRAHSIFRALVKWC